MDPEERSLLRTDSNPEVNVFSYPNSGLSGFLIFSAITVSIASFQFGWNIGVINTPQLVIRDCVESGKSHPLTDCVVMDEWFWGMVTAAFSIGGLVGGLGGGFLCDYLGRKNTLWLNNVFFIVGGLMLALSTNIPLFALGRIVVGLGCGVATAAVPLYLNEIATNGSRGSIGTLHQLATVTGLLAGQVLGLFFSTVPGWRFLLAMTVLPAILQLCLIPFCKETPRYLVSIGNFDEAGSALSRLRNTLDIVDELESMIASEEKEKSTNNEALTIYQLFTRPQYRRSLIIAYLAQISQQFSGINGVLQYSTSIFEEFFGPNTKYVTVAVGLLNVFMTIISVLLMDRVGRRPLLLSSFSGMTVSAIAIVLASCFNFDYAVAIGVLFFVASFAIGLGPIPWLIMPELFPTNAVAPAASIGVMINWFSTFIVSLFFPALAFYLSNFTFLPFAGILSILGFIMYFILPETKNKSLEEVLSMLDRASIK